MRLLFLKIEVLQQPLPGAYWSAHADLASSFAKVSTQDRPFNLRLRLTLHASAFAETEDRAQGKKHLSEAFVALRDCCTYYQSVPHCDAFLLLLHKNIFLCVLIIMSDVLYLLFGFVSRFLCGKPVTAYDAVCSKKMACPPCNSYKQQRENNVKSLAFFSNNSIGS